ncbi:hypothetical protein H6F98_11855 [Microcoleus sp. FACHB-SPT15]|uniref:hypothetical protein n=1 Tax=Microcoleus sp. FACHB-SPT15 TaxID=2692830 RepID=UPI001785C539|nr:hypothetical protein [Microcoleus sp. FACHB-SPT15]MBD1806142.1 hypothetical protein [Microcoleus sp. FACHB-SPT15]
MLKKFGILISTFVGLLTAFGSGMETPAQSTDLSVRFGTPNLQDQTAISENSQTSLEVRSRRPGRRSRSLPCPACGMG